MYNETLLRTRSLEELRVIALNVGLTPHHAAKEESIIMNILLAQQPPEEELKDQPDLSVVETLFKKNTPDEIKGRLEFFGRSGGKIKFDDECWYLQYGIALDSGNLTVPLGLIERKARILLKARKPAKVKIGGEEMLA